MIYERLCSVSARIPPFSTMGARRDDRDLAKAVRFLETRMQVSTQGVFAASYLTSILILISSFIVFILVNASILVAIPISAIASAIAYYAVVSYPISTMNSYKLGLSEEADLVFEQFILVFQTGGTIFDAIEMVAASEHPFLSKVFQNMLSQIQKGTPPETCLMEFAKNQPSDDLRRYIMGILSALEKKTELLDLLSGESFEADMTLRQKNLELESRLLVVAALSTYIPIMLTLAISLAGHATNLMVLLLAPILIGLTALLKTRFSSQFSAYFDRPNRENVLFLHQGHIVAEYDEFLNFVMLLSERLRSGDTLEVAIQAVRDDVAAEVQKLIDPVINAISWGGKSIEEAMSEAARMALGQRVANMINMISVMCAASATDAGDRLSRIAARLVKRSAVAKERESIIAAQRLKVYLLSITSSLVLGLLSALSPFLFIGSLLTEGPIWSPVALSLLSILPLFVTLLITTVSTGYQNTSMVGGRRPLLIGVVCGLLFWASFMLSSAILGLEIV
ncbi:MAG: type II secretion system F family protein [Candidatus Thorarchaeota archaeon]